LKTLAGSMHTMDGLAYFATAVSDESKMLMKLTSGVNFINILHP
jgi:hypothetical protein